MNQPSQSISFPQAIASTQELVKQMSQQQLDESEIKNAIASLVSTQTGARGFFVGYLTGDSSLADDPSPGTIEALQTSPDVVSDLLVKNVAMSSAMKLTHQRNGDTEAANGSQKVTERSIKLIQKLQMNQVAQELNELNSTIEKGTGKYQDFLIRWGYDSEQKERIKQTVASIQEG